MALRKCPRCGNEVAENETVCKYCGYSDYYLNEKKKSKTGGLIIFIGIVIIVFISLGFYILAHLDRAESYKVSNKQELNSKKGINKEIVIPTVTPTVTIIPSVTNTPTVTITPTPTIETTPEPEQIQFDNINIEDYNAINELMDKYFIAKKNCDKDVLSEFTSSPITDEYMEELEASAKYVEDYRVVKNYFIKGYDDNTLIVYTEYKTKFYNIATLASSLSYKFLIKNDSGDWFISEITDSIRQYISLIEVREEVKNLILKVDVEFQKELSEDDNLQKLYDEISN